MPIENAIHYRWSVCKEFCHGILYHHSRCSFVYLLQFASMSYSMIFRYRGLFPGPFFEVLFFNIRSNVGFYYNFPIICYHIIVHSFIYCDLHRRPFPGYSVIDVLFPIFSKISYPIIIFPLSFHIIAYLFTYCDLHRRPFLG